MSEHEVRSKKEIRYEKDGVVEELDIPELQARGIHNFRGWMCNVGKYTLHVNADQRVFYGSCHVGGCIGTPSHRRTPGPRGRDWRRRRNMQYIPCTEDWCYCGSEIQQSKYSPDGSERVDPVDQQYFVVWDLSRRCNFDCSYCPAYVHNRTDEFKTFEELVDIVMLCERYFDGHKPIEFSLSGGEPTIDPNIVHLCKFIRARGHHAHVQSNGSRGKKLWEELIPHVDSITISIHFEFMNMPRLYRNVGYILEHLRDDAVLEVKMIAQEENLKQVQEIRETLLAMPNFVKKARLAVMPVSDFDPDDPLGNRVPRTYDGTQVVEFKYE